MPSIDKDFSMLIQVLKRGDSVQVTPEGEFFVQHPLISLLKNFFCREENKWIALARAFRERLEALEEIPVRFSETGEKVAQCADFFSYMEGAKIILEKLSCFSSKRAEEERYALNREKIALFYRLEGVNGGIDPAEADPALLDLLLSLAQIWKSSQAVFHDCSLSSFDKDLLQKACQFSDFVKFLFADGQSLKEFFEWSLRDRLPIIPFIEFPLLQKKIVKAGLNGRIGRLGGERLRVQKVAVNGEICKLLTLPIQGKEESLLDEERVILFRGNYAVSIREIFQIFENKQFEPGNLEYLQEGIINWNSHRLGWWDADFQEFCPIDLGQKEWWKNLPILEILSLKEARQKFGTHLTGREWNIALISSRLTPNLDFANTHSYSSLSIPLEDGNYAVYPFGKFATLFPQSMLEALFGLGKTLEATVAYPEENVFYTHRQKARLSFAVTKKEAYLYLESVRRDLLLARDGHFVYQIESDNCARWAYQKIEAALGKGRVPSVFQMPLLESEPHGLMEKAFDAVRRLPLLLQKPALWAIHYLLGARQGRWIIENGKAVWKSLSHHSFWRDQIIFHPPRLHQQQEIGALGKYRTLGVTLTGKFAREAYSKFSFFLEALLKRLGVFFAEEKNVSFFALSGQRDAFRVILPQAQNG